MSSAKQVLMSLKTKLGIDVETFKRQYEKTQADYDAVVRAIEILERQDSEISQPQEIMIPASDIDFTGTQNLPERLKRIAHNYNGIINITKAAEILIEVKQSRSKKTNLRSMIYRTLTENNDTWEKVAPGTFQFCDAKDAEEKREDVHPDFLVLAMPESHDRN